MFINRNVNFSRYLFYQRFYWRGNETILCDMNLVGGLAAERLSCNILSSLVHTNFSFFVFTTTEYYNQRIFTVLIEFRVVNDWIILCTTTTTTTIIFISHMSCVSIRKANMTLMIQQRSCLLY